MCQAAMALTSRALNDVGTAEVLLKIKGFIALFIQTMEVRLHHPRFGLLTDTSQGLGLFGINA